MRATPKSRRRCWSAGAAEARAGEARPRWTTEWWSVRTGTAARAKGGWAAVTAAGRTRTGPPSMRLLPQLAPKLTNLSHQLVHFSIQSVDSCNQSTLLVWAA
jgi:hypothetical protein